MGNVWAVLAIGWPAVGLRSHKSIWAVSRGFDQETLGRSGSKRLLRDPDGSVSA